MADSMSIGVSTSEPISFFSWLSRNRDADIQSGQGTRAAVGGGGGDGSGGWGWRFCTAACKAASGNPLRGAGSSTQCSVMTWMDGMVGRLKRDEVHAYVRLIHFSVQQKLHNVVNQLHPNLKKKAREKNKTAHSLGSEDAQLPP